MAWSLEAAALAELARRARLRTGAKGLWHTDRAERLAGAAAPLQVLLAAIGAVVLVAPPEAAREGADLAAAAVALGAVAVAAWAAGVAGRAGAIADGEVVWGVIFDAVAVAALAWLAIVTLDGAPLVAVLAAGAAALAAVARRADARPSDRDAALVGAAALLAAALTHVLAFEAPPLALLDGLDDVGAATIALAACSRRGRAARPGAAARRARRRGGPALPRVGAPRDGGRGRRARADAAERAVGGRRGGRADRGTGP